MENVIKPVLLQSILLTKDANVFDLRKDWESILADAINDTAMFLYVFDSLLSHRVIYRNEICHDYINQWVYLSKYILFEGIATFSIKYNADEYLLVVPITAAKGTLLGVMVFTLNPSQPASSKFISVAEGLGNLIAKDIAQESQIKTLLANQNVSKSKFESTIQTAKVASLNQMASGVAHEVNNPLAVITGYIQVLLQLSERNQLEPEKLASMLGRISLSAERIAKIVSSLRYFAKDSRTETFEIKQVRDIISTVLDFWMAKFTAHHITFSMNNFPEDVDIECQGSQIAQVLNNLLSNAFDAVITKSFRQIVLNVQFNLETLVLKLDDSGDGIAEEIRHLVMQPFFTTKEVGKGTGLGLSVASGILSVHGGKINFDFSLLSSSAFFINLEYQLVHLHTNTKNIWRRQTEREK
ncbi:MAG: hypothetical protein EOP04_15260 [Proteobacteria bacterium]|nr:MAG: hypothetical protein EOP04_15260 [Pseudomonadota bacterium]